MQDIGQSGLRKISNRIENINNYDWNCSFLFPFRLWEGGTDETI